MQRRAGQGRAQRQPGQAARHAQQGRFGQHQRQPLARRGTQHGQQRKLRPALRHAEGQHREHEKRPGEQRHQRQHRQVDAVGAREVAHPLRRIARLGQRGLCGPAGQGLQRLLEGAAVGAGLQLQVDAGELAHAAQQVLRGANVHHRQRCAGGAHGACDLHGQGAQAGLQLQRGAGLGAFERHAQRLQCGGVEVDGGGGKQRVTRRALPRPGHEGWGHGGQQQGISPQQAQGDGGIAWGLCRRAGHGCGFQHGVGAGHVGVGGDLGKQRIGQRALHGAHFQVGLAVDGAHGLRELVQRRCVDDMHGKRQRHAQHDGGHGGGAAPGVVAQVLPREGAKQCEHGGIVQAGLRGAVAGAF